MLKPRETHGRGGRKERRRGQRKEGSKRGHPAEREEARGAETSGEQKGRNGPKGGLPPEDGIVPVFSRRRRARGRKGAKRGPAAGISCKSFHDMVK